MWLSKNISLILFVIALAILMVIVRELRFAGYLNRETQFVIAVTVFGLNIATAIVGMWTPFRRAWGAYLVLTVVCMALLGTSPIGSAWILAKLAVHHIFT